MVENRSSAGYCVTCVIARGDAPFVRTTSYSLGDSTSIHEYAEASYLHTRYVKHKATRAITIIKRVFLTRVLPI